MSFPVLEIVADLKEKLKVHPIIILQAPPGAGKSTVLPLALVNEPWLVNKKIIMLEPRRLAARSVATRMANVLGEDAGNTVGYRVRFENCVSNRTRIEVVTEGILTRMIQHDNTLEDVGLVIFDEFHERSLQADLALALCVQVQKILRDDLRILIMSATLDGEKLSTTLENAPIITSLGRQFPIEHRYISPNGDAPIALRMAKVIRKVFYETTGDILAFFPGAGEIQRAHSLLEEENLPVSLHPLFGDLSFKKQQEAILPNTSGLRKIVLATSLAETSLTIEGVSVVIDSGYARVPKFDPRSGLTRLDTVKVTRDSADQRAGRAGRLGPGICYRLWSEATHHHLVAQRSPEILEADLAPMMLELSQWGTIDINELHWITPPPMGAVNQAKELLEQLGALENGRITTRGKAMLKLPTHPRIAHMLQLSEKDAAELSIATDVAALLEERDPLGKESGADISLRLEVLRRWRSGERVGADKNVLDRIERLAQSWRKFFNIKPDNSIVSDKEVGKLIAEAYPERIARQIEKNSERYKLANGRVVRLPQHDALMREQWLSVAHLDAGVGEGKIFLAAPLDDRDLIHLAEERKSITWDDNRGMIVGVMEQRIGNLVLSAKPLPSISQEERTYVLCNMIRKEGLKVLGWDEQHDAWQARAMSLRLWRKEEPWPDVSDEGLLNTLEQWLSPYLHNINKRIDLQRLELSTILAGIIPWELAAKFDKLAPSKIEVPSGSMITVNYFSDGRMPTMEVRLQEVFGLTETPAVNDGRTKIILHLLSPGYKPVQVTQDLKSFWHSTYHDVRKELRMRYPKHSWPEDPWTAEAVRGVKRKK